MGMYFVKMMVLIIIQQRLFWKKLKKILLLSYDKKKELETLSFTQELFINDFYSYPSTQQGKICF